MRGRPQKRKREEEKGKREKEYLGRRKNIYRERNLPPQNPLFIPSPLTPRLNSLPLHSLTPILIPCHYSLCLHKLFRQFPSMSLVQRKTNKKKKKGKNPQILIQRERGMTMIVRTDPQSKL